jgi:hypothetical protein
MRGQTFVVACTLLALVAACASQPETREESPTRTRSKSSTRAAVKADDHAMAMDMSIGYLDERSVDAAMAPHVPAMIRCFDLAGDARRYLSGLVVLRFVVRGSGSVSDVHVIKNGLGNYPVERCLVGAGRRIAFPPPEGARGTDFEYSMRFRSTGELPVLDWDSDGVATQVTSTGDVSICGSLGPQRVEAIAYVEPAGTIGSVGFASQGPIDPSAAACAEEQMRKVRVSDGRPDVVLRTVFPLVASSQRNSKTDSHRSVKRPRRR